MTLLRSGSGEGESRRASAAVRMLSLRPVTGGEMAVAFQLVEALLDRRGEVRIVRVGTATVAIAGNEPAANEVGGDGSNAAEALVAAACDLVRFDAARERMPADDLDDDAESQGLFAW